LSGFIRGFKFVLELFFADFGEQLAHFRTGLHTYCDEIIASQEWRVNLRLFLEFFGLFEQEVINIKSAMRTQAVEAMELQFERKSRPHQQTPESGFAHLKCILELHMAADGLDNVVGLFAGETEPLEDLVRHISANPFVLVEMNAAGLRIARSGDRFRYIVKKHGPWKRRIRLHGQVFEH